MTSAAVATPEEVRTFWVDEVGPEGWYTKSDALDRTIRERFMATWEAARDGRLFRWNGTTPGSLALLIVLDQFPRNMFRDDGRAYSTDGAARAVSRCALSRGRDMEVDVPARQFFYMPWMHAESLENQARSVRMFLMHMPGSDNVLHARAHRDIIRAFGRFPHRNDELGRQSTPAERAYMDEGGYGAVLRRLKDGAASAA
ncbi:DUF924 family protein [Tropicimonas sp. IMCC34011]|uniref:DUF924 family protein n=1 Tax=Tropicimonas sp. IMCC34011 TaxID=2248759 RepID=UPI000E22C96F|nr:DUF924 family protein [Tropicimonas sp. IMCC34011]